MLSQDIIMDLELLLMEISILLIIAIHIEILMGQHFLFHQMALKFQENQIMFLIIVLLGTMATQDLIMLDH